MCLCTIWMMIESVDTDPAPAPLFIQPYIFIVSEDEQCRKGGDTLERVRYTYTARSRLHGRQAAAHGAHRERPGYITREETLTVIRTVS